MNWHSIGAEADYIRRCRMSEAKAERLVRALRVPSAERRFVRRLGLGRKVHPSGVDVSRQALPEGSQG
jgi:hypothetical protein